MSAADTAAYARRRRERLLDLIEDPWTWREIHTHAADTAADHPRGSVAHSVLTRLANVAADVADLAERPPDPDDPAARRAELLDATQPRRTPR